jgi:hypothetical protein
MVVSKPLVASVVTEGTVASVTTLVDDTFLVTRYAEAVSTLVKIWGDGTVVGGS